MYLNCFYANANEIDDEANEEQQQQQGQQQLLSVNNLQRGLTPLYLSVRKDNMQMVRLLLEDYGADPNVLCFERTALFVAVLKFNVPLIELYVNYYYLLLSLLIERFYQIIGAWCRSEHTLHEIKSVTATHGYSGRSNDDLREAVVESCRSERAQQRLWLAVARQRGEESLRRRPSAASQRREQQRSKRRRRDAADDRSEKGPHRGGAIAARS